MHKISEKKRAELDELTALAFSVLEKPANWMRTHNHNLGDRRPIDLIGTDEQFKVFDLLNAVNKGVF